MTELLPDFVLRILSATSGLGHNPGRMVLIVRRPYAHLVDRLSRLFEGHDEVAVVLDRRGGTRRFMERLVGQDRRRAERRAQKEDVLEVVIEGTPRPRPTDPFGDIDRAPRTGSRGDILPG